MSAHDQLVAALRAVLADCDEGAGWNLPEALSRALTEIAQTDGSERLVEHRPGCWEAEHVRALDRSSLRREVAP